MIVTDCDRTMIVWLMYGSLSPCFPHTKTLLMHSGAKFFLRGGGIGYRCVFPLQNNQHAKERQIYSKIDWVNIYNGNLLYDGGGGGVNLRS